MSSGVSSWSRSSTYCAGDARVARDLEVVAGGVAERRADEALERLRVGGGGPDARRCPGPTRPERPAHPAQVAPRLGGAARGEPVPQVAGESGDAGRRPLGQPAGQPRRREQQPAADRHGVGRSTRLGASGAFAGDLVGLVAAAARGRARVGLAGLHRPGAALEVGRSRRRRRARSA